MQEKHLYEYAIVKLIPRVERGECINVGVILYCKSQTFLEFLYQIDFERVTALFPNADVEEIKSNLTAFQQITAGEKSAGTIALMDASSRFRWLTAKRSTIIQASEVHPGLCINPNKKLLDLYKELVL